MLDENVLFEVLDAAYPCPKFSDVYYVTLYGFDPKTLIGRSNSECSVLVREYKESLKKNEKI